MIHNFIQLVSTLLIVYKQKNQDYFTCSAYKPRSLTITQIVDNIGLCHTDYSYSNPIISQFIKNDWYKSLVEQFIVTKFQILNYLSFESKEHNEKLIISNVHSFINWHLEEDNFEFSKVVPIINLPALDLRNAPLYLNSETLSLIFLGDIFEWNDSRILELQDVLTKTILESMMNFEIHVVVRNDESVTTQLFTRDLSESSRFFADRIGEHDVIDWCEDNMEMISCPDNKYNNGVCTSFPEKKNCFGHRGECEGISWFVDVDVGIVTCAKIQHLDRRWAYTRVSGGNSVISEVSSYEGSIGYTQMYKI
jgi:hypothetical protein